MKILSDKTALKAHITKTLKSYRSVGDAVHVAVVSALWHAAKFGDPIYLNTVYQGLRSNDQQAVKMYIRRVSAIVGLGGAEPEGQASEIIIAAVEQGGILTMNKGEFIVTQGHTSDAAKATVSLCETRLIKPDGKTDRRVLDRNNFAEVKTLGDSEILDQIMRLAKQLETETDTKKLNVSETVSKLVRDFAGKAEVMKTQLDLAA